MKKNILVSLSIVGALSALVIGGTGAVFFDREVAERNIFQAGYIDLETREGDEGWWHGEAGTWNTPTNWAPGETISGVLHLRNDGNVNADRTTIRIDVREVTTNAGRATDNGVTDRTDMDTRIIITQATFGGVDVGNVLVGRTLRDLNGIKVDLGAGIPADGIRTLFLEFRFNCEGEVCAGYQGDRVEANFEISLLQR